MQRSVGAWWSVHKRGYSNRANLQLHCFSQKRSWQLTSLNHSTQIKTTNLEYQSHASSENAQHQEKGCQKIYINSKKIKPNIKLVKSNQENATPQRLC